MLDLRVPADGQLSVPMAWEEFDRWTTETDLPYKAEWYDGLCVMTRPVHRHAIVVSELVRVLLSACPDELFVLVEAAWSAPVGFFVPDLLVCHRDAPADPFLEVAPVLAVEVLSPSTRRTDLTTKREHYAQCGLPWYWVIDPDAPSLSVWSLVDGELRQLQQIGPGRTDVTVGPFAVAVSPDGLLPRSGPATG